MRGYYKKRIACLFFVCVMIVTSLAGCGGNKELNEDGTERQASSIRESSYEETTVETSEETSSQVTSTEEETAQESTTI